MNADPIFGWWNLARFVRVAKRDRIKGDALRAVTLREMAHLMRLFHREAFGTDLRPLGEVGRQIYKRVPDVDPDRDPMRALELVANDFGVSGKPQLVLFVEGPTKLAVLPAIFERLLSAPASRHGIEFSNLGGVGNIAGGKENPFSAIWRLVDYLHHHQTLAFVLLDNEGFARNVVKGLPRAGSVQYIDARRRVRTTSRSGGRTSNSRTSATPRSQGRWTHRPGEGHSRNRTSRPAGARCLPAPGEGPR